MALGHEVTVLQGRYVKAFNVGNKSPATVQVLGFNPSFVISLKNAHATCPDRP